MSRVTESQRISEEPRYVLLTECLQNDFFLNTECRLRLPDTIVPQMLLGTSRFNLHAEGNAPSTARAAANAAGPLGVFLGAAVGARRDDAELSPLHVLNLRDWHVPGSTYDAERRLYGTHCEERTWGAEYLEGLTDFLDPTATGATDDYAEAGAARVYHVRSDSVFDFKPRAEQRGTRRKFRASELEDVLDIVLQGSDDDVQRVRGLLSAGGFPAIHDLAREIDSRDAPQKPHTVYVAVIGVYTDIKVTTLLAGLRTRYDLPNLAVSDTFTASPSLERHLAALDFSARVLGVDIVHGIGDLAAYLGTPPPVTDESTIVTRTSYARYRSYMQDKQNVLAFQDEKLQQYLALTERRSLEVYERIKQANTFLLVFGATFLALTLVFAILGAIRPSTFHWQLVAITGGVGLIQLVSAFFSKPVRDLQQNLTNLAVFKMVLESHSLKTALARYHLTTPQTLREFHAADEVAAARAQIDVLQQQVQAIQAFDSADFASLASLAVAISDRSPSPPPADESSGNGAIVANPSAASAHVDGT